MRKVANSEQVAHLWAHQAQSEARNSTGSMFFEGNTIYSHGGHFPMARHVDDVVLITTKSYSVTTSCHQSVVARACSHLPCFRVPNVKARTESEHLANFADYQARYDETGLKAARARIHTDRYLSDMASYVDQGNRYAEHFGLSDRIVEADIAELQERAKEQTAKKRAEAVERAERNKARWDAEAREFAATVREWRDGLRDRLPSLSYYNPARKRIGALLRIVGDKVQTSQGAEFPVSDVPRAWRIVENCKRNGGTFHANGKRIMLGHFRLDSIDAKGNVKAGCHYVEYSECRLIAQQLNLIEV